MPDKQDIEERKVIEPEIVRDGQDEDVPLTLFQRIVWIIVAVLCAVWIVIPEFTDAVPIIGWLDEGAAAALLFTALAKLRVRIPFLQPIIDWFMGRRGKSKALKKK